MFIRSRIDRACSKDNSHYAISGITVFKPTPSGTPIAATDGRILAITYGDASDGHPIEPGIYTQPPKAGSVIAMRNGGSECRYGTGGDDAKAVAELNASPTICGKVEGRFPPTGDLLKAPHLTEEGTILVTLNATLLANLAAAIGDGSIVTLAINPKQPAKPIAVASMNCGNDGVGLLMPVSSDATYAGIRTRLDMAAAIV